MKTRIKLFSVLIVTGALCAFIKGGTLSSTFKFIHDNFKYNAATKTHYYGSPIQDSIDYYAVDGRGFFQVFMGKDSTVIKQTLGEPDQNWLFTYRYFLDTCCYHLDQQQCSFNCPCLMFRISPEGKCTSVRMGSYIKGQ